MGGILHGRRAAVILRPVSGGTLLDIGPDDAGQRVDRFLRKYLARATFSLVFKLLRTKQVVVNGRKARPEDRLVAGDTVTFHKEVSFQPGGPRQHVYGAVRFLSPPYSTFQIVRAGPAPDAAVLERLTAVVRSWTSP